MTESVIDSPSISQMAFRKALDNGRLSPDQTAKNYIENYMYMGERDGKDLFKNIDTRQYIS